MTLDRAKTQGRGDVPLCVSAPLREIAFFDNPFLCTPSL